MLTCLPQFNVILDDTDVLADELQEWKRPDLSEDRPPPLVVEIYVDTSHLTLNQALVAVDDAGKRWDVADALGGSVKSNPRPTKAGNRHVEVVLERWTVELGDAAGLSSAELNDQLPNVYKKGVVLFRSLYTFTRFLPAWKFHRRLSRQSGNRSALRLKSRILQGPGRESLARTKKKDALLTPLHPSDDATTQDYTFASLLCPAGPLRISVTYRSDCELRVADSEALLSSRFLGSEDSITHPASLPVTREPRGSFAPRNDGVLYSGSNDDKRDERIARYTGVAYGSLNTMHNTGANRDPLAEMRDKSTGGSEDFAFGSSESSGSQAIQPHRRPSIARNAFKAGSYSSTPLKVPPSPSSSLGKQAAEMSKRSSLNVLPQESLRKPSSAVPEFAVGSSGSSSPKPGAPRFQSSFAGRTKRNSSSSKPGDGDSSGRGSTSSKEKANSSEAIHDDLDELQAYLKQLEAVKGGLPSLSNTSAAETSKRMTNNFSKFAKMRDSTTQLSDSIGNSVAALPRSSPHTPAVPSRLSVASVAEDARGSTSITEERHVVHEDEGDEEGLFPFAMGGV